MQKKAIEFERVMAGFSQLLDLWQTANSDSRSGLARGLFQYIVVDLDTQQIVDYRLHPWADQYLIARADLYGGDDDTGFGSIYDADDEDENAEDNGSDTDFEGNKNRFTDVLSDEAVHDPNGYWNRTFTLLECRRQSDAREPLLGHSPPTKTCHREAYSQRRTQRSRLQMLSGR